MFNIETLRSKSVTELTKILKDLGVKVARTSNENDKIFAILDFQASNPKVTKDYFNTSETPAAVTEEQPAEKVVTKPAPKKAAPKKAVKPKVETATEPKETPPAKAPEVIKEPEAIKVEEAPAEEVKAEVTESAPEEKPASPNNRQKRKRVLPPAGNSEIEAQGTIELPLNIDSQPSAPAQQKKRDLKDHNKVSHNKIKKVKTIHSKTVGILKTGIKIIRTKILIKTKIRTDSNISILRDMRSNMNRKKSSASTEWLALKEF